MCQAYISEAEEEDEHIEWICTDCWKRLPRTEQDIIRENSTETALAATVAEKKAMRLVRAGAFLFYQKKHPVQDLVHRMKYADEPELGYWLARQAVLDMKDEHFFDGIDVIIPMPLHPKRLRERGYNQSEYIARGVSAITGIPVDTTHVTRCRNTPKQAQITATDGEGQAKVTELRNANVADAFAVNHPEQMYHKHILLVDDLVTTGATVRACLRAMRAFRGAEFSVFALCKAG